MTAHSLLANLVFLAAVTGYWCTDLEQLPFIAWSNSDAFSSVKQQEVSSVADALEQVELEKLQVLVVLKSKSVTFDNIVKYGGAYGDKNGAFQTLQSELSIAQSSVWSGVHGNPTAELIEALSEELGVQPHYPRDLDWTELCRDSDFPLLLVHDFPVANSYEEFNQQDIVIAKVMDALGQVEVQYAIFYTADSSLSLQNAETSKHRRDIGSNVRTTKSAESSSCAYSFTARNSLGTPCLLFCLTEDQGHYYTYHYGRQQDKCVFSNATLMGHSVRCEGEENTIPEFEMEFQTRCQNSSREKLHIRFLFPSGSSNYTQGDYIVHGYWRMDLQVETGPESAPGELGDTLIRTHTAKLLYSLFAVSHGSSYSCASSNYNSYSVNGSVVDGYYTGGVIEFAGVQVQPYETIYSEGEYAVFSSSSNCEGFLSLPAWMAVITMLLLVLVFYVSLLIAFSVQTMEQFDDPRGETISVENLH